MGRAERRYRTQKIATWRARLYPSEWNTPGRFRKWNLTCQCKWCKIGKYCDIALQRLKDERRNSLVEVESR